MTSARRAALQSRSGMDIHPGQTRSARFRKHPERTITFPRLLCTQSEQVREKVARSGYLMHLN